MEGGCLWTNGSNKSQGEKQQEIAIKRAFIIIPLFGQPTTPQTPGLKKWVLLRDNTKDMFLRGNGSCLYFVRKFCDIIYFVSTFVQMMMIIWVLEAKY